MIDTWRESILTSLAERDKREKSQIDIITAYTNLAIRTAFLESKISSLQLNRPGLQLPSSSSTPGIQAGLPPQLPNPSTTPTPHPHTHPLNAKIPSRSSSQTNLPLATTPAPTSVDISHPAFAQLKSDLALAQRTKATLTTDLATLRAQHSQLTSAHATCKSQVTQLTAERDTFSRKLSTREEEMQYKNKQVERLHDDIIALDMQLNVLHDQKDALQNEYDELVKRMMKYKEREAEDMINNSEYS